MTWLPVVGSVIALVGVAMGLLVGIIQKRTDRLEAARVREEDRQYRVDEWLRAERMIRYSALFVVLRELPSLDVLKELRADARMSTLSKASRDADKHLASLILLVNDETAEAGIEVQRAAYRYSTSARAIVAKNFDVPEETINEAHVLYQQQYESHWGNLAELMRVELGVTQPR